jgi:hypothetical protein
MLIATMFGLLWLVVDLRKDDRNMHGVLVDRMTGRPLETASTAFTVVDGVLVSRSKTGDADRRSHYKQRTLATPPF